MTNLLIKLFVKDYKNVKNPHVRKQYGVLATVFGILSNTCICIMKFIIGFIFGAISIIADGVNNLADACSSIVALIGFKLSSKKADKGHPYGHARLEYISALIVSILVTVLGIELVINSIKKVITPEPYPTEFPWLICILLGIAILVKLYQAIFNYKIGKRIDSISLIATSQDSRNDCITTLVVLIGTILSYLLKFQLDGYFGICVGIFVSISGIKLIVETSSPLIGTAPEKELVESFLKIVKGHEEVLGIHDLQIHSYGSGNYYASCHVEVDSRKNILELHDVIDNIERECMETLNIQTVLHMDPIVIGDVLQDKLKKEVEALLEELPFSTKMHDFRIVKGPTHTNIVFDVVVPFSVKESDEQIKKMIQEKVEALKEGYYCYPSIDHDYVNDLEDSTKN